MRFTILLILLFGTAYGQSKKDEAYKLGVEGIQLVDAGNFAEGIKLLKKARNLQPHDYDYAFEIGKAYASSGEPKKAEKYLFELQYHQNVTDDLYLLLANCYNQINDGKNTPDEDRKKELDILRYGIQRLPNSGVLYLQLGKRNIELEKTAEALAAFEQGLQKTPNFAENYFWASKLLKASGNTYWSWVYAEVCFSMTDDIEIQRSCGIIIQQCMETFAKTGFNSSVNGNSDCVVGKPDITSQIQLRECMLGNRNYSQSSAGELFGRMKLLQEKNLLEAYVASVYEPTHKESFLAWLSQNAAAYETYRSWRYWNPLKLSLPIQRL